MAKTGNANSSKLLSGFDSEISEFLSHIIHGTGITYPLLVAYFALRILGMSWGVKNTFFEAPGVSLGGSGVSIGGVKMVRVMVNFGCKIEFKLAT